MQPTAVVVDAEPQAPNPYGAESSPILAEAVHEIGAGPEGSKRLGIAAYYRSLLRSPGFDDPAMSLHFGYWSRGLSPFSLISMLDRMTIEGLAELDLEASNREGGCGDREGGEACAAPRLLDLGAGRGRPARIASRLYPGAAVLGVDVLLDQVRSARADGRAGDPAPVRRPAFACADFTTLPLKQRSIDAAFALEALCHAETPAVDRAVAELARVLRPGGRVAVAEPFLRNRRPRSRAGREEGGSLERWSRRALHVQSTYDIDAFCGRLEKEGFSGVERREVTWRLAPSALCLQWLLARRALSSAGVGSRAESLQLWLALTLAMSVGLRRRHGYFLVRARL